MKRITHIVILIVITTICFSCDKAGQTINYENDKTFDNDVQTTTAFNESTVLRSKAKESYFQTFGSQSDGIEITKVDVLKTDETEVYTIYYKGDNRLESTFIVLKALVDGVISNGVELNANEPVTIDCTGSCDCRERFYPGDASIECTCSDCKMTIIAEQGT